jgi:arylsulfate sulfotransferase
VVRNNRPAVACLVLLLSVFTAGSLAASTNSAGVVIDLSPSITSPQFLGTSVTWTATVHSPFLGHIYDYQFAVILDNQYQIVRDFSAANTFTWVPYTVEGTYRVVVNVRDITKQPYTIYPSAITTYVMLPWVTAPGTSAVHPTPHPLVALFSGPPCQTGHTLLARFHPVNSNVSSATNAVACSQNSANFYVAGMLPSTQYLIHWEEYSGNNLVSSGADLPFVTGALSSNYPKPTFTVNVPPTQYDSQYPVVYWEFFPAGGPTYWPTATDLAGNVIWYFPGPMFVARREVGGNFFTFPDDMTFREYDIADNITLETNVEILNEQLAKKGYPTMNDFNEHEARRLPNGNILLLGSRDAAFTDHQGGTQQDPVDIIGDMILVLDHNMQLVWAWDSFAHDNLDRKATLNDQCMQNQGGCPKFNKNFAVANDWLHSNAVQLTSDGNLMLSERSQDYVIKVNYQNGQGDGKVLWRMGPYGDITLLNPSQKNSCGDPSVFPWFTHQHDSAYQADAIKTQIGMHVMTVFDDGNLRNSQCGGGQNSRGMLFLVSETAKTASLVTLADLGAFSGALGSGDLLQRSDGLFTSYGNGFINMNETQSTEVDLQGKIVYQIQANTVSYRTYRMQDLYTPTLP